MARVKAGRRLFPFEDLLVSDLRDIFIAIDTDEAKIVLAALMGLGPTQPHMIATDESGRLLIGAGVLQLGNVGIVGPNATQAEVSPWTAADGFLNSHNAMLVGAEALLFDGTNMVRGRAASAASLSAQNSIGAAETTPPGMWSAVSNPGTGVVASATRAAGGAGVRHVATAIIITWGAVAAPAATGLTWQLRDGATGVGTILAQGQLTVPAAAFQGPPVVITDIALPGSPATAMTLEFSAALASLLEGVTLLGFDAA